MKTSKSVSIGQILFVILVAVILIAAIVSLTIYLNLKNNDDRSALNKDIALSSLRENDPLTGSFNGKSIIISSKDMIFEMLKSDKWRYLPDFNREFNGSLIFEIGENYHLAFNDDSVAEISYNDKSRYYSVPSEILSSISAFIYDNSFISVKDASAFLSGAENITVSVLGSSKTIDSGDQLATAMNIAAWTETNTVNPDFEPTVVVDTKSGLKISIYKSINIGVIDYLGTSTVYSVNELSVASSELVAKSYFNDVSALFDGITSDVDQITVKKGGKEYNISPDTSLDLLLDVPRWQRRFTAPAGLPENADIVINGGKSLTVNLYSVYSVAEYENTYYNVPSAVFSSISEYLKSNLDKPETVSNLKTTVSNAISDKKQISVQYKGSGYTVSVQPDFLSALNISSWTESPVLELIGDPDLVFDISKLPDLTLCFYTSKYSVLVINGNEKQVFRVSSSISESLINYVQENLYTEAWSVSATELGALQKNADSVEVTVTDQNSFREKYGENTDDALSVLAAIDLLPLEIVPELSSVEKTEILFKGPEKFLMTIFPASEDTAFVNVTGTFYSRGRYIDRWFICSSSYNSIINSLMEINQKSLDTAAALFCEALRNGDTESLYRLIGNSSFDYSAIKTLMLNDLTILSSDDHGIYVVQLNVEDPVDSPFEKGIKDYILTVGSSGGALSVISFIPEDEYNTIKLSDPAVLAVDRFTSWVDAAGISFESISDFENKSSIADYLMMLCKRDDLGTISPDNPSLLMITKDEMSSAAKKYFGQVNFEAFDIRSFNAETGMYYYEGISAPSRFKHVSQLSFEDTTVIVKYKWYADPLCLYCTDVVDYTLSKNEDGTFAILSAVSSNSTEPVKENLENSQDSESSDASSDTSEESAKNDSADNEESSENSENNDNDVFIPPSGLTPTETMFKYFEYLNEKNVEKSNSLLYETYAKNDEEYLFDELNKISVKSCAEISPDFDWYEPWYRSPFAYSCVVAEVDVDCISDKWLIYTKDFASVEIYMIKATEDSDWRIIAEKPSGEGLLAVQ